VRNDKWIPVPSFEGKTSGNDRRNDKWVPVPSFEGKTSGNDKKKEIMKIKDRVKAPTPKFFRVLRNIGLVLAAVGGTVVASPIALPVVLTTIGGYLAVAGGVVSAVSQLTTEEEELPTSKDEPQ